jgi:predicted Zn-dependent protease with MMP-like domain
LSHPLEAAAAALDAGRPEEALVMLEGQGGPDAGLLCAWAHLDLGELDEARAFFERAAPDLPDQDLDRCWLEAELLLREWRIDGARAAFEALIADQREPAFLERLALVLELQDDFPGADALLVEAAGDLPVPTRLSATEFDAQLDRARAELPEAFQETLARCRIVIEPVPFRGLIDERDPGFTPPDLLGLFHGPDLTELAEDASAQLPPTIYLFQRNLERACLDGELLREQIRVTLYHELGHLLGLDEDEVEALGLG